MSATRCIKLALLLSLIPLALRAASLLHLAGHAAVPATATVSSSRHRQSWTARHDGGGSSSSSRATAAASAGPARDGDRDRPYRHATTHRRRIAATRLLRQVNSGDWFEDDKRLAPTGSNPLHNLR